MKGKKRNLFSYTSLTVFRASNFIILLFSKYNWQDQNWVIMRGELLGVRQYKSYLPTSQHLEEDLSPRTWSINMYGGHGFINTMKLTKHKMLGRRQCKLQSRRRAQDRENGIPLQQLYSLSQPSSSNGQKPCIVIYCILSELCHGTMNTLNSHLQGTLFSDILMDPGWLHLELCSQQCCR